MSNWMVRGSKDWLEPVYDVLHQQLVQHDLLHADETELQVLHEPGKTAQSRSYMWLYRTSGDAERPIVLYEYQPSRSGEHPRAFLKGFHGYLQTDGYSGYNAVEDVIHVGCLSREPQLRQHRPAIHYSRKGHVTEPEIDDFVIWNIGRRCNCSQAGDSSSSAGNE